jgi:hypothetical protein
VNTIEDGEGSAETALERNARVTALLVEFAPRLGLTAVTEYPVPGGRIDVVWLWHASAGIPGVEAELPIVGFEIESSWRTRKHIKGDLLNLQDLRPLLGVIVLLGQGPDVESTRRFASQLVNRPGTRVVVWSEQDLEMLLGGEGTVEETPAEPVPVSSARVPVAEGRSDHAGKYKPLWKWLCQQPDSPVSVTFATIEETLGFALPPSCRRHLPHWYGYDGTAVGRAIRDAGWRARHVDLLAETVIFERLQVDPGE